MSTLATAPSPGTPPVFHHAKLQGSAKRLTASRRAGLLVACIVVSLGLFTVTPLQGRADFAVFVLAFYLVAQTVVSFVVEGRRWAADRLLSAFVHTALIAALIPLAGVLIYTVDKGLKKISLNFLTHNLVGVGPLDTDGGELHAIIGTVEVVGLTIIMATPLGLLVAVYITEYGRGWLASGIRFVVDVMTGIPSIVAGLFIFAFLVLDLHAGYSGFAGSLALTILMFPVVVRASEEMIKLVPNELREAAYALGVPKWKVILRIVLPTASAGITTGVMIAIARVTGETAPLLLTSFITTETNTSPFAGKQTTLPTFIFDQAGQGQKITYDRAWAAALTLIVIVLILYVGARLLTRRNQLTTQR